MNERPGVVGAKQTSGCRPLHVVAATSGDPHLIRVLLRAGADPQALLGPSNPIVPNCTAFEVAKALGTAACARALEEGGAESDAQRRRA